MFCKYCGAQMADSDKFCTTCGQAASAPEPPAKTPVMKTPQASNSPRKRISWKIWIPIVAVLCALIIGIIAFLPGKSNANDNGLLSGITHSNTYKTPLDLQMNILNARNESDFLSAKASSYTLFEYETIKEALKLQFENSSEDHYYSDGDPESMALAKGEDGEDLNIEYYGKDFAYYYKITETDRLDKDELSSFQDELRDVAEEALDFCEDTKYFDNSEWAYYAEKWEFSRVEAHQYVDLMEKLYTGLQSGEITDGYIITYSIWVKGSKLDKPEEVMPEERMCVLKINGKWVSHGRVFND